MSRGTLRYDSSELQSLLSELRTVRSALDRADEHSSTTADAVGHSGLADRIRSFSTGWDGMRGDLSDAIGELMETAAKVDEAFDEAERALETSVSGDRR
ncbi:MULTISPECIES: hypothetical protein [Curtobacterium]|uniref:hypothetical protein n=1 Tax=Curtobacterium flaccumfaciens TaxID=2035 RepID=UPI003EE5B041